MIISPSKWIALIFFSLAFHLTHSVTYINRDIPGPACPNRGCRGYQNDLNYLKRSCECDSACHAYGDCCGDIKKEDSERSSRLQNIMCLNYNENPHEGVYVISKCIRNWNGSSQVKEKCEGSQDLSDPISAAPATSTSQKVTYKNLYCAECNNANTESLKLFAFKIGCEGVDDMPVDQLVENLSYNQNRKHWGINRPIRGREGQLEFVACQIYFDLPGYLNSSVRFCRSNIVSECARNWTRNQVKRNCKDYMSVVVDNSRAFRNPHCAQCNHVADADIRCFFHSPDKNRPFSLSTLIDVNRELNRGNSCPSNQVYDPYMKKCRKLTCALPGYVIQNGRCTPGN